MMSSLILGPKTIAAQQRLSDRYGIPTFGISGGISTIPSSGRLSNINVGVGQYTDYSPGGFTTNLQNVIDSVIKVGGSIGNTSFSNQISMPTDNSGIITVPPSSAPSQGSQIQSLGNIGTVLKQGLASIGPTGIVLGGLFLIVVLLKK